MTDTLLLASLFFVIALVYASAGFGGGSSYLAVLALFGVAMPTMRPVALLCNLAVVSGNLLVFRQQDLFDWKKNWPLAAVSVPLAFLGGAWPLKEKTFLVLLGVSLVAAAGLLFAAGFQAKMTGERPPPPPAGATAVALSGGVGFLSGLVGIGGGIFLSPILNLLRWDLPKRIAATASFFILVNSISGLVGQLSRRAVVDWQLAVPLFLAVILGGQLGSRLSALRFSQTRVRQVTAVLVLYAGINLLWQNL